MKRRGRSTGGRARSLLSPAAIAHGWPHAVDLDVPGCGFGSVRMKRMQDWLRERSWQRGSGRGMGVACYRFASEADADAFAAEFGGRRSS